MALSAASARALAASARVRSMSSARSPISARMFTRSGSTSQKPQKQVKCDFSLPRRYVISPAPSVERNGVWPGRTPKYPSAPGAATTSTSSRRRRPAGGTTSTVSFVGRGKGPLLFQVVGLLQHFLDGPDHVEGLLRQVVQLAVHDHLEAADRVGQRHVLAGDLGELLGHVERLGEELLDLTCPGHRDLLLLAELVDAEDGDDVLEVLVRLEDMLDVTGHLVVLLAEDAGVEDARGGGQGIHRRVDAELGDLPRQVGGGV